MSVILRVGLAACLVIAGAVAAHAADPAWMSDKALVAAAQKEGEVILFSSFNEDELLGRLKVFSEATGIKTNGVRGGDEALISRVQIANRASRQIWDAIEISNLRALPDEWTTEFVPTEAVHLIPEARDERRRWYGTELVFHVPAYNTTRIKKADLPTSYADFANHPELKGKVAIESTDRHWLNGIFTHYGEARANAMFESIIKAVDPIAYPSHIGLARALGSGEFAVTLSNFLNLTLNVQRAGAPTDFWVLDPVIITMHQYGVNPKGPHVNAAKLLANYLISAEGQTQNTRYGRLPVRRDVTTDPPGLLDLVKDRHTIVPMPTAEEESRWQKRLDAMFRKRER